MKYKAFEKMMVYILCIIYIFINEVTIIKILPLHMEVSMISILICIIKTKREGLKEAADVKNKLWAITVNIS